MKKLLLKFFKNDPIRKIVETLNLLIDKIEAIEKVLETIKKEKNNVKAS